MTSPAISIVVPTRRRPESLARCLAALDAQRLGEAFEIVVVADGPGEADRVERVVERFPRARLLRSPPRGPAAARNAGAAAAHGAIVCFTDDDCEPTPGWLAALVTCLRAGAEAAAGVTTNGVEENGFAVASQFVAEYFAGHAGTRFAASNNLGCWSGLLRAVPFDGRYADAGGEDRDWCARIAARGIALVRVPEAVVEHHHRLTLMRFLAQHLHYGRGSYAYHRGGGDGRPFETRGFYLGLVRGGLRRGPSIGFLVALSQSTIAAGFVWEAARTRLRRR